ALAGALTVTFFAPDQEDPTTTCSRDPSPATSFSRAPGIAALSVFAESSRPGEYWMTVVSTPCRVPSTTLAPHPAARRSPAALAASPRVPTPLMTRTLMSRGATVRPPDLAGAVGEALAGELGEAFGASTIGLSRWIWSNSRPAALSSHSTVDW